MSDWIGGLEKSVPFFPTLENFEGPLELLILLIQKDELDIKSLPMIQLIEQFSKHIQNELTLDQHAENLVQAATLLLWKSQRLLPNQIVEPQEETNRLEIFQKLIEYCRFKEVARLLSSLEDARSKVFHRPYQELPVAKNPGVEQVSLNELSSLLRDVLKRVPHREGLIPIEDLWQLSDYIEKIQVEIKQCTFIKLPTLFENASCKEEAIVIFLALLELMKQNRIQINTHSSPPTVTWLH